MVRVMFARALTGEWLDLEAPARAPQSTEARNSPGDVTFSLPVEYRARVAEDGRPVLARGETLAVVVDDDGSVVAGLVDSIVLDGKRVRVSAGGLSMQAKEVPWTVGVQDLTGADPVEVFREVWDHLNGYDNHVPLAVTGDEWSTGVVGGGESYEHRDRRAALEEAERLLERARGRVKSAEAGMRAAAGDLFAAVGRDSVGPVRVGGSSEAPSDPQAVWIDGSTARVYRRVPARVVDGATVPGRREWVSVAGVGAEVDAYLEEVARRDAARDEVSERRAAVKSRRAALDEVKDGAPEPYLLSWHSTPDLMQVIGDLADSGPFGWQEWARLDPDSAELSLGIRVGAPRLGVRRDSPEGPRFELGVNVQDHPSVQSAERYTDVKVYGAGEGSAVLHEYRVLEVPGLVRRVLSITDKDAGTRDRVRKIADREVRRLKRQQSHGLDSLTVIDHPFARPGSYGVGDEIRVTGRMSDGADLDVWVRIDEITRTYDGKVSLGVEEV